MPAHRPDRLWGTAGVAALAVLLLTGSACGQGRHGPAVALGFRAGAGTRLEYDVDVVASVASRLSGPPEHHQNRLHLRAVQAVLESSNTGVRVKVDVDPGTGPHDVRHFVARLDRGGGLAAIESVDGVPTTISGELGPAEVFPGATDAIPKRPLRSGERWRIDEMLTLPDATSRLKGTGRLVGLRSAAGTARVATTTSLPVRRKVAASEGNVQMIGTQTTTTDADYDIATGVVVRARATTIGRFVLVVAPPAGSSKRPLQGSLEVQVISQTVRRGAKTSGNQVEPTTTTRSALAGIAPGGGVESGAMVALGPTALASVRASRSRPGLY